jgi:uncharacterized membrane protein YdfJ with MMPL/SSD domain
VIRPITDFAASRRGKWITLALWIVISAIITPLAPKLAEVTSNDQSSFLPSGAESTRVADLVKPTFRAAAHRPSSSFVTPMAFPSAT